MKALKFKLFATMITLAAVTYISIIPANAQRRSTERSPAKTESRSENEVRKSVQTKSTFKTNDKVNRQTVNRPVTNRRSSSPAKMEKSTATRNNTAVRNNTNRNTMPAAQRKVNTKENMRSKTSTGTVNRPAATNRNNNRGVNSGTAYNTPRNQSRDVAVNRGSVNRGNEKSTAVRNNTSRSSNNNRDFYRIDNNDRRYAPSKDFRGKNEYWNERNRPGNMNYNHSNRDFYRNYSYNNYKHWDRNWERYRWNYSSWRDYYRGYNPRSFTYYKYYYHHPHFGHVISRFDFRPTVFFHNRVKYYCYDGHFFRYRPGIGYILIDLPYGFTFDVMPRGYYERVYINGYLYFRVGNLFFESNGYGFSLVHFPDRYYAWDSGYEREGYYFDDLYY